MNGIRIRPFEAAAILAALTLLTGCSLLKFSVDTGGEPLSKEETRMRLLTRGFYYEASDEVTAAADSIAAGSDDAELQRRTIRWKLRTTRAAVDAAMQQAVAEQMSEAKPVSAQEEIEAANTVFEKYGFAFYDLAASSPKSDKTRRSCAVAVGTLLHSPVLFASMQNAHSLPIKALAQRRVRADAHPSPGLHCSGGAAHRRRLPHPLHLSADHAQGGRAMRAIITDIREGKVAALAEDGTVHLVDAKNRAVGQEIRIPAKRRRRWKKPLTWAACVAVLCGMATTGVYAAYEPYASVSVVGGTDSVEYTVNRFDQVLGARVSGREQPPDGKIPRFAHIDKAVEHTVRQEAKEGERVSITVTSRSGGHAERLREHIDDRFRQSGDKRNPPEVRVQPPQDTGNAPGESRQSESAEQA